MKKSKAWSNLKWLLPVVALVVIFESVVLVGRLNKGDSRLGGDVLVRSPEDSFSQAPADEVEGVFSFVTDKEAYEAGETGRATLIFEPVLDLEIDGAELVVSYDPALVKIADANKEEAGIQIVSLAQISSVVVNKVSEKEGKIVLALAETGMENGLIMAAGSQVEMMAKDFEVLETGPVGFGLVGAETNDEGTMMAKTGTSGQVVNYEILGE